MDKSIKALVVSDTHGNATQISAIAKKFPDADYVFHLGDYSMDSNKLKEQMPNAKFFCVKGNCDFVSDLPEFSEVVIRNNKIILTHGHLLKVKYSYERAFYYAKEKDAAAILFGHTHIPYSEFEDGVWLINPGTAGDNQRGKMSVAMLLIGEYGIVPKIIEI